MLRRGCLLTVRVLGVVVTQVQGTVVADDVVRLGLERDHLPPGRGEVVLQLGLDGNVVEGYHRLRHGVVGCVHVNAKTGKTPVEVRGEVVGINVLAVEDAGREKMRGLGLHIRLLVMAPLSVCTGGLLSLLVLEARVGALWSLQMINLRLGGPASVIMSVTFYSY